MAPHVQLRHPGAVGRPVQIDGREAEGRAHLLEIADGDAGGVVPDPVALLRETGAGRLEQPGQVIRPGLPVVGKRAVERRGAAGAPLIDQHDGVVAVDAGECRRVARVQIGRGLSRTAREEEQRRGRGAAVQRRNLGHGKVDGRAAGRGGVLGHRQGAAARGRGIQAQGMFEAALVQRQGAGRRRAPAAAQRAADADESRPNQPHVVHRTPRGDFFRGVV